ncbi:MAG: glycosyltransferase family 2 protein [Bacteroidales bacterium]|nr:glycosyltransferase family 2 protein [Bacteroidales bacterium]
MTTKNNTDSEQKQPLVSIGVPVYNGEQYLEECLESIKNQSYSNWECVICNNTSTDLTPVIAGKYVKLDPRFRLFHTSELLPMTDNWNFCFSKISHQSKYFKILPADDWIYPEFISQMVSVMENHPEVGICSSFRLVDKMIKSVGLDYYHGNQFNGKEMLVRQLKKELNITSSVNAVMYRIDTLKELVYYPRIFQDEPFHQDTFLSYELLVLSDLGFVFQILSYTRRHEDSVTSTVTTKLNTFLFFREYVLFYYNSRDPSLEDEYRRERIRYAYFFLKNKLLRKKEILNWHRNRLKRPIRFIEYFLAVMRKILPRKMNR